MNIPTKLKNRFDMTKLIFFNQNARKLLDDEGITRQQIQKDFEILYENTKENVGVRPMKDT